MHHQGMVQLYHAVLRLRCMVPHRRWIQPILGSYVVIQAEDQIG